MKSPRRKVYKVRPSFKSKRSYSSKRSKFIKSKRSPKKSHKSHKRRSPKKSRKRSPMNSPNRRSPVSMSPLNHRRKELTDYELYKDSNIAINKIGKKGCNKCSDRFVF